MSTRRTPLTFAVPDIKPWTSGKQIGIDWSCVIAISSTIAYIILRFAISVDWSSNGNVRSNDRNRVHSRCTEWIWTSTRTSVRTRGKRSSRQPTRKKEVRRRNSKSAVQWRIRVRMFALWMSSSRKSPRRKRSRSEQSPLSVSLWWNFVFSRNLLVCGTDSDVNQCLKILSVRLARWTTNWLLDVFRIILRWSIMIKSMSALSIRSKHNRSMVRDEQFRWRSVIKFCNFRLFAGLADGPRDSSRGHVTEKTPVEYG